MNATLFQTALKVLHKGYIKLMGDPKSGESFYIERNPDKASDMICHLLMSDFPCMIARFGSTELSCIVNYLGVTNLHHSVWKYIKGEQSQWWWNKNIMNQMQQWSGFFPATEEKLSQFCEMMIKDAQEVDLLGSWLRNEYKVLDDNDKVDRVWLPWLEPFHAKEPWSRVLKDRNVLVVHPFFEEIVSQYNNHRERLFADNRVLPKFASLRVVKAVQSLGGESNGFKDWFEALDWMKHEMDKAPYDIALIGCGAYGFPLAAHAKRTGHKAVHLGGSLQLLFGIKGKRWDKDRAGFYNNYWTRPIVPSIPQNAKDVEDGCYW